MKKMVLVIGVILFMFGFTAEAADKKDVKQKKTTNKCWKKMPPLEKQLMSPEYNTVCTAFEEVLNKTCEPPEKLKCNWTLPEGEKKFKKLDWKQLDPKEYWGLIKDLRVSGVREDLRDGLWTQKEESKIRKLFGEGKRNLVITTVDIDGDGKVEQIVRDDNTPCEGNTGVTFGVINPETKRVDWNRNNVFFHTNALSEGSEVLLYEGRAFMFKWGTGPWVINVYKGFSLFGGTEFGSRDICRFQYLKVGKKK